MSISSNIKRPSLFTILVASIVLVFLVDAVLIVAVLQNRNQPGQEQGSDSGNNSDTTPTYPGVSTPEDPTPPPVDPDGALFVELMAAFRKAVGGKQGYNPDNTYVVGFVQRIQNSSVAPWQSVIVKMHDSVVAFGGDFEGWFYRLGSTGEWSYLAYNGYYMLCTDLDPHSSALAFADATCTSPAAGSPRVKVKDFFANQ
jgi:hypothetical protein